MRIIGAADKSTSSDLKLEVSPNTDSPSCSKSDNTCMDKNSVQ